MWAVDDDMAVVQATLSAEVAAAVWSAVVAAAATLSASSRADDERTADQLRADVFAAPFLAAVADGVLAGAEPVRLARRRREPALVQVTVPASTLMGIADLPGELAGYGPISADLARDIARDATWRRILTDPATGAVLDVGTTSYRPTAAIVRHVEARDRTCRAPGCRRRGHGCDLDHTVPFPDGPTAVTNLGVTCRTDHRFKHHRSVDVHQVSPGVFVWRFPTGHFYVVDGTDDGPQPGDDPLAGPHRRPGDGDPGG